MPNHVTEWLNAYQDGELHGSRLHTVETHLAGCESCQAELRSLRDLSGLLRSVPGPEFPSPERFASQVNLLLPHKPATAPNSRLFEISWWMIPVGLLVAWIFISTASIVGNMISTANNLGLVDAANTLLISGTPNAINWTSALSQFGFLEGNSLQWLRLTEDYSRNVISQIVWQASIVLLYLAWMAIWWSRQARQEYGRLLQG